MNDFINHFDHTSPELADDTYGKYQTLREQCPLGHTDKHGGFYFVNRYDDVTAVIKNFRNFSNRDGVAIPRQPTSPMYPLDLDPPLQTEFRTILQPLFHISEAEALAGDIEAEVDDMLDKAIPLGQFDLADICLNIPTKFALKVIGIEDEYAEQLSEWVDVLTHERTGEKAADAGANMQQFVLDWIAQRRLAPRKKDVISALFECEVKGMGGALDDDAISRVAYVLIFGGLHTTRSAMLESFYYLATHSKTKQEMLEHLDDDVFWKLAVEELIRYSTPTQFIKRQVNDSAQVHDTLLQDGDDILLMLGSANHDETQFEDPETVKLDRCPNRHVSFGMGAHRCIGQHLGRVFLRSALKRVLARIPDYKIADGFKPHYLVGESRAMVSLPITC